MPEYRDEGFVGEFWGSAGAGILFQARNTGRYLLLKRSWQVEDPGLWGIPGGAVPVDARGRRMDLWGAARRETFEETHRRVGVRAKRLGSYTWQAPGGTFRYTTFVVEVAREFEPRLNWESEGSWWFTAAEIEEGRRVHPGVAWVFGQMVPEAPRGRGTRTRGRGNLARRVGWVRAQYGEAAARELAGVISTLVASHGDVRRFEKFLPWVGREIATIHRLTGTVGEVDRRGFAAALPLIVDWQQGARVEGRRIDLGRFTFKEAKAAQERWHAELAAHGGRKLGPKDQGKILWCSPSGWTLQELAATQVQAEGEAMGHCVGGEGYRTRVALGSIAIWSLRDPRGQPHATVEVGRGPETRRRPSHIVQVQGKGGRLPVRRHRERLLDALLSGPLRSNLPADLPPWSKLAKQRGASAPKYLEKLLPTLGTMEMFALRRLPPAWFWWEVIPTPSEVSQTPAWEFWHRSWHVAVSVDGGVVTVAAQWEVPDDLLNGASSALYDQWKQYNSQRVAGREFEDEFDAYLDNEGRVDVFPDLFRGGDDFDGSPVVDVADSIRAGSAVGDVAEAINGLVDPVLLRADAAETLAWAKVDAWRRGELPSHLRSLMRWEPSRW